MAKVTTASPAVRARLSDIQAAINAIRRDVQRTGIPRDIFLFVDYDDHWEVKEVDVGLGDFTIAVDTPAGVVAQYGMRCLDAPRGYDQIRGPQDPENRPEDLERD